MTMISPKKQELHHHHHTSRHYHLVQELHHQLFIGQEAPFSYQDDSKPLLPETHNGGVPSWKLFHSVFPKYYAKECRIMMSQWVSDTTGLTWKPAAKVALD